MQKLPNSEYQLVFKSGDVFTYSGQKDFVITSLHSKYMPEELGDGIGFNYNTTSGSIYYKYD